MYRIALIISIHTIACLCKARFIVLIFLSYFSLSLFPKAVILICVMSALGWYVSLKGSVAVCRSPLRICINNVIYCSASFTQHFLKFMFLYIHLVLTATSFFSICIHHILLLHFHNDRHLDCLQLPTSKTVLKQTTFVYLSIY